MNEIKTDRVYNKIEKKILEKHPNLDYTRISNTCWDDPIFKPISLAGGYYDIEVLEAIIKVCEATWKRQNNV